MTGRLALTFDDRHVDNWVAARPLIDAVDARVTFFVVEADLLDHREQAGIRTLLADGHTVGSHGARHRNADQAIVLDGPTAYLADEIDPSVQALRALGATASAFAYPNSRRDESSDAVLLQRFKHLRGGGPRTGDPIAAAHAVSPPGSAVRVHPGRGMDTARGDHPHPADADVLSGMLRRLADHGGTLVLYAHDIAASSPANHVHPDRLRHVLSEATALGLDLVGMDDLPHTEGHRER
ncbi:peptidoglycan/xylan/chitin deacetylase (PgdA/CDA1 family) [Microbacterium natoriense]|uniref:Peptidoglycan/xylan/chitin deacetylase (PgdA/CDA1 family) n=1 Tax=Microbacterium natoriense TaxID=284570 RepID=A0AAW8EWE0_9MICO|nr:polysaccharide deacetylase family protein [Microbacterium natoriense]MDQ0646531.1 peptidoglycan/xylan/chitin deacetylase (PgdA/CDA1 family) [Microbacterium natoriense]